MMDALDTVVAQMRKRCLESAGRYSGSLNDAWLARVVRPVRFDPPHDLGDGWCAIGKVHHHSANRRALVAIHEDGRTKVEWAAEAASDE